MTDIEQAVIFAILFTKIQQTKRHLYSNYIDQMGFYDGMAFSIGELDAYQYELDQLKSGALIKPISWPEITHIFKRFMNNKLLRGNYLYSVEEIINHTLLNKLTTVMIGIHLYEEWKARKKKTSPEE